MNDKTLDYLMRKMDSRKSGRDSRDYEDSRNYRDSRDSRDYKEDFRRGDGRGLVDFEGSMDFRDEERYASRRDSRDRRTQGYGDGKGVGYSRDSRDYHRMPKLSKTDIHHWKQMMENEDGTRGPHYDMQQIVDIAEKHGIKFDEFDEKEFCIAVNMMYSDYCKVAKKYVAPDKELAFFADLAKAFLEDEDGPEASEKLALYFHCIVDA